MKNFFYFVLITQMILSSLFAQSELKEFTESSLKAMGAPNNPKVEIAWNRYYDSKEIGKDLGQYAAACRRILRRDTIGAVVVVGNQIASADLFCSRHLCGELWDKLIRSHALDCVSSGRWDRCTINQHEVRRFLNRVYRASFHYEGSPGVGRSIRITSGSTEGSALSYKEALIHLVLFPKHHVPVEPLR